jgi:hypothetical protein
LKFNKISKLCINPILKLHHIYIQRVVSPTFAI